MTDKELRKLSRAELLEILVMQGKTIDELKAQVEGLERKLEAQDVQIQNAGSIAEASMRLSGVFEAAERSAQIYLANVQRLERESQKRREDADALYAQVQAKCRDLLDRTRASCDALRRQADTGTKGE